METTTGTAGRDILERFLAAAERGDHATASACAHPDVVMEWPQSGERFTGRDNALAAMGATEEKPEFAGEPRIVGDGDAWVVMLPLRYGSETYHYVGVFELEAGLIRRSTEYFGAPFPPQEARARFADGAGATA
jgi:hypothetical protein